MYPSSPKNDALCITHWYKVFIITSLGFAKNALALLLDIVAFAIKDVSPINTLSDVRSFSVTTRDEILLLIVMLKVCVA